MKARIAELVQAFELKPHPEGGFYRETYRSVLKNEENQSLMTSIYFLLTSDSPSHFHRIQSDEHWYFHEGNPLTIHLLTDKGLETIQLGLDLAKNQTPHALVEGNTIFGSEIQAADGYALVSCVVSPGFDFSTFELFTKEDLLPEFSSHEALVQRLT